MASRREAYTRTLPAHRVRAADREWTAFEDMCRDLGVAADLGSVPLYLVAHESEGGRSISQRLARLDLAAFIRGVPAPSHSPDTKRFLRGLRSTSPIGAPVPKADPLYGGHGSSPLRWCTGSDPSPGVRL